MGYHEAHITPQSLRRSRVRHRLQPPRLNLELGILLFLYLPLSVAGRSGLVVKELAVSMDTETHAAFSYPLVSRGEANQLLGVQCGHGIGAPLIVTEFDLATEGASTSTMVPTWPRTSPFSGISRNTATSKEVPSPAPPSFQRIEHVTNRGGIFANQDNPTTPNSGCPTVSLQFKVYDVPGSVLIGSAAKASSFMAASISAARSSSASAAVIPAGIERHAPYAVRGGCSELRQ